MSSEIPGCKQFRKNSGGPNSSLITHYSSSLSCNLQIYFMYDSNSKGISYLGGFFILIAFAVAGIIIGSLISMPIWMVMTGKNLIAMKDELGNPAYSNAFKVMQAVSTFFGFFLPTILTANLLSRKPLKLIGFTKKINGRQVLLVLGIMFAGLYTAASFGYLNQHIPLPSSWGKYFQKLENNYNQQVNAIMQLKTFGDYLVGIIIMAFLPALCEETLFRGGLQNFLTRSIKNPWLAILIVSILFSLVHLSFYGFLVRLFLGVVLGLIYYYTGSVWLCIIGHFANNAFAVSQYYFSNVRPMKEMTTENTPLVMFFVGLIALPILIILLALLKKASPPPEEEKKFSFEEIQNKPPWEIDSR